MNADKGSGVGPERHCGVVRMVGRDLQANAKVCIDDIKGLLS